MIFLYILVGLFSYFLFLWLFRIFFLIVALKLAGKVKRQIETDIKEKLNSLKGAVKENE